MLPAFKGRINRKTFILGNAVGLAVLGFAALIYVLPLAIIDIVVNSSQGAASSTIFKVLYGVFVIPAIFYFFYFAVLFVKRLHDIGYPGMLILWFVIISQILPHVISVPPINILGILIVLAVCAVPGQKIRNNFGPAPHKKFKLDHIVIRF